MGHLEYGTLFFTELEFLSSKGWPINHLKAAVIHHKGGYLMTREDSIQLARLWMSLNELKSRLDNEIIPLGSHLALEDPELMIALETLSERIQYHFDRYRLQALPAKRV